VTSVRRRFNRQPLRGNGPACLCQVSTPDALIERKAIGQAPLFFWTGCRAERNTARGGTVTCVNRGEDAILDGCTTTQSGAR
jgi:hypothetical protein